MQRLAAVLGVLGEVVRELVLVQPELAAGVAHDQRATELRHPGPLDRVHDLERVLDRQSLGDVQEGAVAPEGGVGGLELVTVDRQPPRVPARDELRVLAEGLLQRAQDHAPLGELRVELDARDPVRSLHQPTGPRALGQRAGDDVGHLPPVRGDARGGALAERLERLQVEALQARGPEARPPPDGELELLVGGSGLLAQLLEARPAVARAGSVEGVVEGRLAVAPGLHLHRLSHGCGSGSPGTA